MKFSAIAFVRSSMRSAQSPLASSFVALTVACTLLGAADAAPQAWSTKNPMLVHHLERPSTKLDHCHGDCDSDIDCAAGLHCQLRTALEEVQACGGSAVPTWDYCVDPNRLVDRGDDAAAGKLLGHCHGDCDGDHHCAVGHSCVQREGNEAIEGCKGVGAAGIDYCVRDTSAPTPAPTPCPRGTTWTDLLNPQVCNTYRVCLPTEYEARPGAPHRDRECVARSLPVSVSHDMLATPENVLTGDPHTFPFETTGEDLDVTSTFNNVRFFSVKPSAAPVHNLPCEWGPRHPDWCFYNGFNAKPAECVNDGNWGWRYHIPVKRVALRTAHYDHMKSAVVWIYDADGGVLDRQVLTAGHGDKLVTFEASEPVIAKVLLDISEDGTFFCLHRIYWGGRPMQKCSHIQCVHEFHRCGFQQVDGGGMTIQQHHRDRAHCSRQNPGGGGSLIDLGAGKNAFCHENGNCDGLQLHSSVRVTHLGLRAHDETVCKLHHRCGMGIHSGDTSQCECGTY